MMRKVIGILLIVLGLGYVFVSFDFLPAIGDSSAPAHKHVSDYYIENALKDTNSPNLVTAVLADYRGFDTLLETTVMFSAGVCVVMILGSKSPLRKRYLVPKEILKGKPYGGIPAYKTVNKDVMTTLIEILILLYAIYVLLHGEVGPGGGFQAGALIALAYIVNVMVAPDIKPLFKFTKINAVVAAGIGVFIYAFAGLLTMFAGGAFLEYGKLPFPIPENDLHPVGIMMIETGVAIGVMATIITILIAIIERVRFDDDRN